MKLIVVTAPTFFVEEDQIITALFEEGLDILHLRKPDAQVIYAERLLTLIPERYHRRIVIHEHFHLKEEFGLMGIHLNQHCPQEPQNYSGHVSCTCHTLEEVRDKKSLYDYVFMSPIFSHVSPDGVVAAGYTPEVLRQAGREKLIDSRVMALGGINCDNVIQIKDYGFGGAVVMGDLWNRFNACTDRDYTGIIQYFARLRELVE